MTTTTLSDDAFSFVCTLVRDRSAIELESNKSYLVEARLAQLATKEGYKSTNELVQSARSRRKRGIEDSIVEALTTNETSFYRDIHPFDTLKTTIIPELREKLASHKTLNIWSAACSTGQEIYSIAILIKENFPELADWRVDLLGTDLSEEVYERAEKGLYSQVEVNRGLKANLLVKYFARSGVSWQLRDEVRSMASFRKLNLIGNWPVMPQMDVIFLRNVLIYFSPENKKTVLRKIKRVLAPHGVLFLGAAETTINLDDSFERVQSGNSVYYRLK